MKKSNNSRLSDEQLISNISSIRSTHSLSQLQKKQILSDILPKKPWIATYAQSISAVALVLLIAAFPIIQSAGPGSVLYRAKRIIEDARSSIQPSFDEQLIERRNEEIEQNSGDEKKVEVAKQEKEKIEERNSERADQDSTSRETNEIPKSTETSSPQSGSGGSSGSGHSEPHEDSPEAGSTPGSQRTEIHNESDEDESEDEDRESSEVRSLKDQCEESLDARKKAGEKISSDLYKTCEML